MEEDWDAFKILTGKLAGRDLCRLRSRWWGIIKMYLKLIDANTTLVGYRNVYACAVQCQKKFFSQ